MTQGIEDSRARSSGVDDRNLGLLTNLRDAFLGSFELGPIPESRENVRVRIRLCNRHLRKTHSLRGFHPFFSSGSGVLCFELASDGNRFVYYSLLLNLCQIR